MKIKHLLSGLVLAAAATTSVYAVDVCSPQIGNNSAAAGVCTPICEKTGGKFGGNWSNDRNHPPVKACISGGKGQAVCGCTEPPPPPKPVAAESCWWMESKPPYTWVKSPMPAADKAACQKLDSCSPTGGKASGGGCYVWAAVAPNAPAKPQPIKGFTDAFAPSKWEVGNNTSRPIARVTDSVAELGNDPAWASSGTTLRVKAPAAGTFEYTYSMSNGSASCPGAMGIAPNFKYVNSGGGTEKLKVAAGQTIEFAVNGKNQPSDFACKDAQGVVTLKVTNISFTFD